MPAANARIRTASSSAAASVALPATTVPAEPKAPVSCCTRSVSDCRTVTRPAVVDRAVAASWAWTVVVPLPNSAVPTSAAYVPSGRSRTLEWAKWPRGGTVSIMDSAVPSP